MESYEETFERLKGNRALFNAKLRKDCLVGDGDVVPSIQRQAQTYMEWGYLHALAESHCRRAKYELQEDVPAIFRDRAEDACKAAGKKSTINNVQDQLVLLDPYRDARNTFIEAEELALRCKHAVEAMRQKLFSLQSLNSRQKSELNSLGRET